MARVTNSLPVPLSPSAITLMRLSATCEIVPATDSYWSFAYSALASFRMGMSGSASFQRVRKSL
jgi:hypothetical protein